jgi:hypothetical protein
MYDADQLMVVDTVLMNAATSEATTIPRIPTGRKSSMRSG